MFTTCTLCGDNASDPEKLLDFGSKKIFFKHKDCENGTAYICEECSSDIRAQRIPSSGAEYPDRYHFICPECGDEVVRGSSTTVPPGGARLKERESEVDEDSKLEEDAEELLTEDVEPPSEVMDEPSEDQSEFERLVSEGKFDAAEEKLDEMHDDDGK